MGSSSYARIAGLQSEVGRVVVTRVAGSMVDFKRQINMYHKDLTVSVNTIRREQIKMRRRNRKYAKKLKQTRIENVKRVADEQKRDEERALLEALHLRLKAEAAEARTRRYSKDVKDSESRSRTASVDSEVHGDEPVSPSNLQFKHGPIFIETGHKNKHVHEDHMKSGELNVETKKSNTLGGNKEIRPYSVLPMINEDLEKENEAEQSDSVLESDKVDDASINADKVDQVDGQTKDLLTADESRINDDELSVSSFGGKKRHKKKEISFSDIIKLKYRKTKQLFDLVHVLAKRHGIQDIEEKVPDPRDNIVHRGASDDSFGLQASFLYPMKYGYDVDDETDNDDDERTGQLFPPLNVISPSVGSEEDPPLEGRKLSLDERRQLFLSGKHSRSTDNSNSSGSSSQQSNIIEDTQPRLKSKDKSMPLLVEKVNQVKQKQRAMSETDRPNTLQLLSPPKPSSSRSSRSLPPLTQNTGKGHSVSWTQAVGLIRAIRSIET